ncbi:ankyrin repeat domain-containing protein SOWAHB [Erythrolamprus reginae]|uniref:ankyrin repeat domain-containing protein SOWAHB n=1 Tax=Erythrolamprus reginae TaxID=121349 RepID=UPI00396CE90C
MARELSQAELLDFLCQAGGRVANAALLGHFKGFLRDPRADPAQLQQRRQLFKGFVNSVATVSQDGPGAATYVVLKKRYRDLIGEEPGRGPWPEPPPRAPDARCKGDRAGIESPESAAGRKKVGRCPGDIPGVGSRPPGREKAAPRRPLDEPTSPDPSLLLEKARRSNGLSLPVREMGPLPKAASVHQRIRDWIVTHHAPSRDSPFQPMGAEEEFCPVPAWFQSSDRSRPCGSLDFEPGSQSSEGIMTYHAPSREHPYQLLGVGEEFCPVPTWSQSSDQSRPCRSLDFEPGSQSSEGIVTHHAPSRERPYQLLGAGEEFCPVPAWSQSSDQSRPCGSLDFAPGSESSEGWRDSPPVPVFRSIRCRLSLQDLEDHLEQESSVSEGGSSGESGHHPREMDKAGRTNGYVRNPAGHEGTLGGGPHSNDLGEMMMPLLQDHKPPPHVALLHRIVGRATTKNQTESSDLSKPVARKTGRLPPSNLDAPLSPRLVPRQRLVAKAPLAVKLAPNPDGPSAEHRSSSVPLESREHTWLVKIATGSWMQVRALFHEDPNLALHRDFVSGFTVLHWLAKHGNVQVLQDVITGAQEAEIVLDVNVRSGCGYTPLHLAAIHSHSLVMKILVQKLQCRTHIRDSSGKKAWQYLNANASGEIWQLLGGPRGRTIFPTHPIAKPSAVSSSSTSLARKVSRKPSLANYLKPQLMKRKKGCHCSVLQEIEEYSD